MVVNAGFCPTGFGFGGVSLFRLGVETLDSRLIPGHGVFRSKISEFRGISIWKATDLGFRAEYGWLSKLGSRLGPFCIRVAYYFGELKRDPSLENYPCRSLRSETVRAVLYFIRRRQDRPEKAVMEPSYRTSSRPEADGLQVGGTPGSGAPASQHSRCSIACSSIYFACGTGRRAPGGLRT